MNGVVEQARNEIENAGYEQLTTADEVDKVLQQNGTSLVMVNSVLWMCGEELHVQQHHMRYTMINYLIDLLQYLLDKIKRLRNRLETILRVAPSSPSFALIKDGKITEMIERHQIEGHDVMDVINQLQGLFDKYCDER